MARARTYRVYGTDTSILSASGDTGVLNDYLLRLAASLVPSITGEAIKQTAGVINAKMKTGFRRIAKSTKALSYIQKSRYYDEAKYGQVLKKKKNPGEDLGIGGRGLLKAIGYQYFPNKREAVIGWLSNSAVRYAARFQEGSTRTVTAEEAKTYLEAYNNARANGDSRYNYRPKAGSSIRVTGRPVIRPFMESQGSNISNILADKLAEKLGLISKDKLEERLTISLRDIASLNTRGTRNQDFTYEAVVAIVNRFYQQALDAVKGA